MMGMSARNQDISIPGQSNHSCGDQGNLQQTYKDGPQQTCEIRILDKGIEVQPDTIPDDPASGIQDEMFWLVEVRKIER